MRVVILATLVLLGTPRLVFGAPPTSPTATSASAFCSGTPAEVTLLTTATFSLTDVVVSGVNSQVHLREGEATSAKLSFLIQKTTTSGDSETITKTFSTPLIFHSKVTVQCFGQVFVTVSGTTQ
jgi:hypothetical protein